MISFDIGSVYLFKQHSIYPPKYKMHLCVHKEEQAAWFFLINSENRVGYHCTEALLASRYAFLKHNSFISCSHIFQEFSNNPTIKLLGYLDQEDLQKVLEKTKTAKTLSPQDKQMISSALLPKIKNI